MAKQRPRVAAVQRGIRKGRLPSEFGEVSPRRILRGSKATSAQKRYIRNTTQRIKAKRST